MAQFKRFPLDIELRGGKPMLLESLGWAFDKKEIDYAGNRGISAVRYYNCMINKSMWKQGKELFNDNMVVVSDIKLGDSIRYDNYIRCYSDGSNDKVNASYGYVIIHSDIKENTIGLIEGSKNVGNGTNSVGELRGAIDCLEYLLEYIKENNVTVSLIELCSDSNYVILGITAYIPNQIKRGWKNMDKKPTPHRDLWEKIFMLIDNINEIADLRFKWVKGHKLKIADTRKIQDDEFFNELDIPLVESTVECDLNIDLLDVIINERCDVLAKAAMKA